MNGEALAARVEALAEVMRPHRMTPYDDGEGGTLWRHASAAEQARAILVSDWFADRIAEARCDALRAMAAEIKRDHTIPFGANRNHPWPYRNGYYDGAHNAARVVDKAAALAHPDSDPDG